MYLFRFSCTSCYVLNEFARLDCVIISLVIRLTSVSVPGLWVLSYIVTGNRSAEPYLNYIKQPFEKNPSTVNKQERGVENCALQVIFYLCDFYLASYARVIDIGAVGIALIRHIASFTHSLHLFTLEHFSARKIFYKSNKCHEC